MNVKGVLPIVLIIISILVLVPIAVFIWFVNDKILTVAPHDLKTEISYSGYLNFLKGNTDEEWHTIWEQLWDCSEAIKVPAGIVKQFSTTQEAADNVLEHIRTYIFWADIPVEGQFNFRRLSGSRLELYGFSYYTDYIEVRISVDRAISAALYQISGTNDVFEKVAAIDRFLRKNIKYSDEDNQEGQTIYSALVRGTSVCAGYAVSFNVLALLSGMNSRIVVGYLQTAPNKMTRHAWNMVIVDGVEYYTDSTTNATSKTKRIINVSENELYKHGYTSPEEYAGAVGIKT